MVKISESMKAHPLVKILTKIKFKKFEENPDPKYKKGFNNCYFLILKHLSETNKSSLYIEIEDLKSDIKILQDRNKQLSNNELLDNEKRQYKKDLALNILGLINKGKIDDAKDQLEYWSKLKIE